MKNTVTNYLTKVSNNQIKSIVDRKKLIVTETLCDTAMQELKKIYWYEKELLIAIPMLIKNATTFELVESLTLLNIYTREHVKLLEKQFPQINKESVDKKKIIMKTISKLRLVIIMLVMATTLPTFANTIVKTDAPISNTTANDSKTEVLLNRLKEIRDMDKSNLSRADKKSLRKEVKEIKTTMRTTSNGVYLSIGAIIIIILLLILIL
jgi:hypothetical protein